MYMAMTSSASYGAAEDVVYEMVRAYGQLISWLHDKKAITSSSNASGKLPWLLPLVADLCNAMATAPGVGARWALGMLPGVGGQALVFAAKACLGQGHHLAAMDLLKAYTTNVPAKVG